MPDLNRNEKTWCFGCQQLKERTGFIFSLNPWHSKYLPLCRSCITERFKKYVEATNSESGALWCMCAEMGYPVVKKYYDLAVQRKEETERMNLFVAYHNILKEKRFKMEGFWQSDVMLSDVMLTAVDMENEEKWLAQQEKIWGKFEKKDYELLNEYYNSYTIEVDTSDFSLRARYQDIAKGELRLRKANESGDVGEIDKAQKNLKALLDMLGLNDYAKRDTDERKQFIDRMAWIIEETEPAEEEDKEKYRDIAGYEAAFENIMRSMKNLNSKVRVYPPVPEEEQ